MWHVEDDPESKALQQTVADHGDLLYWRIRRFPALAMRGRAAEARARAVARGTSTRFHVAATRDPYSFAGTPAERAAFENGAWMPWFAFEHSRPEGGLTVMGDGMRAVVRGIIGPLRGFSISGNCEVIPALAGDKSSLLGKGLGTLAKWYLDVDNNSFDGLHLSATYGCAAIAGTEYSVHATTCVHPMTLARPFISPSWRSPVRDLLERCQAELRVSHVKPTNQPAFYSHIVASARYCHPLGPATSDGPAPRLIVVTNVEKRGVRLSVTYDTVDILDSMDDGEENGSATKTSRTGVCATATAGFSRPHLPTLLGASVRYYGEGFRLTGSLGWAFNPMTPAGGPAWHTALAWQHRFQRFTVGAVATCVVHNEILPRFGVHVSYRL